MTTYRGYHTRTGRGGYLVTVEREPHMEVELDPRTDLRSHSPDGFAWGYMGSGPAQLALALAADVLGDDDRALRIYQDLKSHVVGLWDQLTSWKVSGDTLAAAIRALEATQTLGESRPVSAQTALARAVAGGSSAL